MPIPIAFVEASDWKSLNSAVHNFGDAENVSEDDLLAALQVLDVWRKRCTDPFTFEYRGEKITWNHYESLTWALGESFRRIMVRNKKLRRCERLFTAVRSLCFEERFGKGRESFVMLLGRYGGSAQIPTLIKLLEDPDVSGHAVYALRLLGAAEATDNVRPFLNSPKTWVRKQAEKFFEKIEKAE